MVAVHPHKAAHTSTKQITRIKVFIIFLHIPSFYPILGYFDYTFLFEEDWDRINEEAVVDTETVDEISDAFTDTTLKVNGVEDGIISYSRVVELLLWYYDNQEK